MNGPGKFRRKKKSYIIMGAILVLIAAAVLYNIYDNHRFVVVEQDITISSLPEEFDGYRILQISDLHGKYFGEKQSRLLSAVNKLDYDCLLLTGDMNQFETSDSVSSQAVLDFLSGIKNKEMILWVDGNTGPFAIEAIDGSQTRKLTDMGKTIEQMGVQVLLEPVEVTRGKASIWFVPELCMADIQMNYLDVSEDMFENEKNYQNVQIYGKTLEKWYEQLNENGQIKIRVDHYPIQANLTEDNWNFMGYLDYTLSIAGHYHGGQIRLPLIGALYIPSPTSGIYNGYFPAQKEVKGLNQIVDMQQYISAGLGASASISFLDFRLFNTPEINRITLKQQKE